MGTNKQFNTILDECLESLLTGKETPEQCLQRYPEYARELEPLLRTALIVNKAVDVKPSVDFRAKARYQLQSIIAESRAPKRATRFVSKWAIAICAVMLVFVLVGGTALAANGSMPGNPLYAVKLATENLSIRLTGSAEKKAELYITMADRRVTEMIWMVDNGKTQYLEAATLRLQNYYAKIGELPLAENTEEVLSSANMTNQTVARPALTAIPTETQTTVPAPTTAATTATTAKGTMTTTELPPTALPAVTAPFSRQNGSNSAAGPHGNVNTTANLKTAEDIKLLNILQNNAVTQPQQIQELLNSNKVPEAVKPALRRALAASKIDYQIAIDNLNNQ